MRRPSRKQARPGVERLEGRVVLSLSPVAAGSPAPFSAIVKLDITYPDGEEFVGTGAMIDSYHVLTAGHVVYSYDHGGWAASITATPELHGRAEPFGSAQSTYVRTFSTWIAYDQGHQGLTSPDAMDVGLVTLDKAIGYQTGWFTYGYNNSTGAFAPGTVFATAGYPAANGYDGRAMQYSSGGIDGLSSGGGGIMYHDPSITIYGGQSGSPMWSPSNGVVYGVAVADSFAIRITQNIANQLQAWVAGDTPPHAPARVSYAPPTIQGGAYSVAPGRSLTLSQAQLLAGSYDPQGLPLSSYNVTYPTRGTLTRNPADGSYTYTPYPGIYGSDSFSIQATDGLQYSNIATITVQVAPPAVSLPSNSMLLVAFGSGDFYQYNAAPELFTRGVKSMGAARGADGSMYYLVVYANGDLYRYDKSGVAPLYGGVKSAGIAIDPTGMPVYEIVFNNGDLYQVDSKGATRLMGGVNTATVTYSSAGFPVYEIVFTNNELYQFDVTGVHLISGGVQSASATYLPNDQLAYEIVYQGGWLVQCDAAGAHFLYGGVAAASLVNMYVPPSAIAKPRTAVRTSAPAPVATAASEGVADAGGSQGKAVVAAGPWARAEAPARRWWIASDRPRRTLATPGSARIRPWASSAIGS
jgi:V8-like Glu-specific endopeptidase